MGPCELTEHEYDTSNQTRATEYRYLQFKDKIADHYEITCKGIGRHLLLVIKLVVLGRQVIWAASSQRVTPSHSACGPRST